MNYKQKAKETFIELFFENWMTKKDWEIFQQKAQKICGYNVQALEFDLNSNYVQHGAIDRKLVDIKRRVYLK